MEAAVLFEELSSFRLLVVFLPLVPLCEQLLSSEQHLRLRPTCLPAFLLRLFFTAAASPQYSSSSPSMASNLGAARGALLLYLVVLVGGRGRAVEPGRAT